MARQFFSGNTVEQAVMAAARHYDLDPDRVAYKQRDKKHGFLNVRRRVVIEVDPSAPEKLESAAREVAAGPPAPAAARSPSESRSTPAPSMSVPLRHPPESRPPSPPASDDTSSDRAFDDRDDGIEHHRQAILEEFDEELAEYEAELADDGAEVADGAADATTADKEVAAFEKAVEEVLELLGLDIDGTVQRGDRVFSIELSGPDDEVLVAKQGQLLSSIEHLLPRVVRGLLGYGLPCTVDCDGFQAAHELELQELAEEMAELVQNQGRARLLQPMNPADRRIVHMTLADEPAVDTSSEGEGYLKRVRVFPA